MVYEDPAESGYADFKLMAAAFRVWVRHASALRALRVAREAAVENWMIAVSFWEAQTLRRCLARWRGRKNVMQLHALRFWYGETLRGRFLYWRELTTRLKIGMHTAGATHRAQVTKKYFYAWKVTASMSKEEQLKFARAMAIWGGNAKQYYFAKWKSILASMKELGGNLEGRRRDRVRSMAYVRWRAAYHEKIHRRELLARAAAKFRSRAVSAAFEGALAGIRSIALSQVYSREDIGEEVSFEAAEQWGAKVLKPLVDMPFASRTLVNVNFPPLRAADVGDALDR